MKLLNSILVISGLVHARYYHGNGKCGTLESCSGNLILSREDGCCNAKTLCKMYSEEDDFKEVFPDLDCDNLPEDNSVDNPDREPENPDKKPENPDKKPENDDHSDHEMEPESHLNFEPHNSNIQNFINYNTDFETKINFNMGGAQEQKEHDHKVEGEPVVSKPCPEITMQEIIWKLQERLNLTAPIPMIHFDALDVPELREHLQQILERG